MKSKERIVFEAFKLFCLKPYDKVVFSDIEKATNLSRGAILYHFKAKENIFYRVVEDYVLNINSITSIEKEKRAHLQLFITAFVEQVKKTKSQMKTWGIKNMNEALLHIESSAYTFYPQMQERAKIWQDQQLQVWKEVIANAVKNKEIRNDVDLNKIASLFDNVYMGLSFLSIPHKQGVEIKELQANFESLYQLLRL